MKEISRTVLGMASPPVVTNINSDGEGILYAKLSSIYGKEQKITAYDSTIILNRCYDGNIPTDLDIMRVSRTGSQSIIGGTYHGPDEIGSRREFLLRLDTLDERIQEITACESSSEIMRIFDIAYNGHYTLTDVIDDFENSIVGDPEEKESQKGLPMLRVF